MRKLNIGIVGANGFLGKNLIKKLDKKFYNISRISIRDKSILLNSSERDLNQIKKIFSSLNIIIDCSNPQYPNNDNIKFMKDAKNFCKLMESLNFSKDCNYILISSISIFDPKLKIIDAKSIPDPKNYYGLSKLYKENWIKNNMYQSSRINKYNIIRPSGIVGLEMPNTFIKRSVDKALNNFDLEVFSNESMFNGIIYITNLIEIIISMFYENKKVLTLGSKEPISLELLMQIIKKFTNSNSKIVANYLGRSPYTIDESAWQGKEDYLKDTKSSLLLFLKDYLGNFSYNIPNK